MSERPVIKFSKTENKNMKNEISTPSDPANPADTSSHSTTETESHLREKLKEWILTRLSFILLLVGILSLLMFVSWLWIGLVWPAHDNQRTRIVRDLVNDSKLTIDYPNNFLANGTSSPVYLTTDSHQPISVTIGISGDLPLVLVSVEPLSALERDGGSDGYLVLSWPISTTNSPHSDVDSQIPLASTSTPTTSSIVIIATGTLSSSVAPPSYPALNGSIPLIGQPNTIVLQLRNADTSRGWPPFGGFTHTTLSIFNLGDPLEFPVSIETTDRANLRRFADKYSFIAILPFLLSVLGFIYRAYTERHNKHQRDAEQALEGFKSAMAKGEIEITRKHYADLERLEKYLTMEDRNRSKRINDFSQRSIPATDIRPEEFTTWTDAWAGALICAAPPNTLPASGSQNGKAIKGPPENTEAQQQEFGTQEYFRLVRLFPSDQLAVSTEERFRNFKRAGLRMPKEQGLEWPPRAKPPEPSAGKTSAKPGTIAHIDLFPHSTADHLEEQAYLFSTTDRFWREHPVYIDIQQGTKSLLIHGQPGTGRTALAFAVTKYAPQDKSVLGILHKGVPTPISIRRLLIQEILRFIELRASRLMLLGSEDRELLASLLSSSLDKEHLLAYLATLIANLGEDKDEVEKAGKGEQADTEEQADTKEQVGTEEQTGTKEQTGNDPKNAAHVLKQHAQTELRLLRASIEKRNVGPIISNELWFLSLCHCAKLVGFERIRIAVDMTAPKPLTHAQQGHLNEILQASQNDYSIPIQIILIVDESQKDLSETLSVDRRELSWSPIDGTDHLLSMSKHRTREAGLEDLISVYLTALGELVHAAQGNPKRLAQLWQRIAQKHGDTGVLTEEMVNDAKESVNG